MTAMRIPVLYGSMRRDRAGIRAVHWVMQALAARGHEPVLVDTMAVQFPLLDRMFKEYPKGEAPADMQRVADIFRSAHGFLIVSGEYNHGIPPALKNLLDHFLEEYFWRPSGIVCYSAGQFGGVRAAMQLRMTLGELGMPSIPSLMPIPRIRTALSEAGVAEDARLDRSLKRFLDEFIWYADALRKGARAGVPY